MAPLEEFFQQHESWSIGNGKSIHPWNHKWLHADFTIASLDITIPPDLLNIKVADLVKHDGKWNLDVLVNWLPEEVISLLQAIPPPMTHDEMDSCVWPYSNSGIYKVSDNYNILCNQQIIDNTSLWSQICHLETIERVRHFIWLITHGRLLTNERKARLHLGDPSCYNCQSEIESSLHVLRNCSPAKEMWLHLINAKFRHSLFRCNLQDWIFFNMQNQVGMHSHLPWSAIWANGCHLLWNWRNKRIHEDSFVMPWNTWSIPLAMTSDF